MTHADVRDHLGDYLEGALPLDRRALLDAHLDDCESCARELEELRTTVRMLRALSAVDEPTEVAAAVMRRIALGEAQPSLWQRVVDTVDVWARPRALALVAAGATALAGVLIFEPDLLRGPGEDLARRPSEPTLAAGRVVVPTFMPRRELGTGREPSAAVESPSMALRAPEGIDPNPPHLELVLLPRDPLLHAQTLEDLTRRGLVRVRLHSTADVYRDLLLQREQAPAPMLDPSAFASPGLTPVDYRGGP